MKSWLRPIVVIGVVGLAAFALFAGVQSKGEDPEPVRIVGLRRVFPEPGVVALRQDAFGAELDFGYTGSLAIDDIEIPDDQLDRIAGINRLSFTPGVDRQGRPKEVTSLDEGRHCASVRFWPTATGPESAGPPRVWCFTAA